VPSGEYSAGGGSGGNGWSFPIPNIFWKKFRD
jgi:hypothetical protein